MSPHTCKRCPRTEQETGALQVPIKVLMAVFDLEGCSPLQPREKNIVLPGSRGAEGPAPFKPPIKALMAVIDLEGCSPLQPREKNIPQGSAAGQSTASLDNTLSKVTLIG